MRRRLRGMGLSLMGKKTRKSRLLGELFVLTLVSLIGIVQKN